MPLQVGAVLLIKLILLTLGLLSASLRAHGQNRYTTFKYLTGAPSTYVAHGACVFDGRYRSVYDKAANVRTLEPHPATELAQETGKTAARTTVTRRLGQPCPVFRVADYTGRSFDSQQLRGRVVVLNFWLVGGGPCEMERAALNRLHARYQGNPDIVFVSFVRSSRPEVAQFLQESPFSYPIVELDKALQHQLQPSAFPTNVVLNRQGQFAYEAVGGGIGAVSLLAAAIAQAQAAP